MVCVSSAQIETDKKYQRIVQTRQQRFNVSQFLNSAQTVPTHKLYMLTINAPICLPPQQKLVSLLREENVYISQLYTMCLI